MQKQLGSQASATASSAAAAASSRAGDPDGLLPLPRSVSANQAKRVLSLLGQVDRLGPGRYEHTNPQTGTRHQVHLAPAGRASCTCPAATLGHRACYVMLAAYLQEGFTGTAA